MGHSENSPESEIRDRIASQGRITFAEFMGLALYHPNGGYYTTPSPFGAAGDFFTSPLAHPSFGALIATQLHRMWDLLQRPSRFDVVEMGAGSGGLARDILQCAQGLSEAFVRSLHYVALERYTGDSPDASSTSAQRVIASAVPLKGVVGCIISNELVDSFPVHRFVIRDGAVSEVFVTLDDRGSLTEVYGEPSSPLLGQRLVDLDLQLAEGYEGEVNLNVRPWISDLAESLERGFVLTIDYGYEAEELYSAKRAKGTLQTYRAHTQTDSPYEQIGNQDITAHVDFSLLATEGEAIGLRTSGLVSQERFLRDQGFDAMLAALRARRLPQREHDANMMAMHQLVNPDGLGGFKVMVQERGTGVEDWGDLLTQGGQTSNIDVPLLRPDHIPLLDGRYPHLAWEPQELWPRES